MSRNLVRVAAVLISLTFVAAACGDDDSSDGDDETTTFLSNVFKVMENYDDGFLDSGRVTTISDLIASREEQQTNRLSMESFHNAKKSKRESHFLFAMLMCVSVPSMKTSDLSFPTFKKN